MQKRHRPGAAGGGLGRGLGLTYLGSTLPLLVAPGKPASGVRPIDVSQLFPFLIAHALAPEPRWSAMMLVSLSGLPKNSATERVMNE